MKLAIGQGWKRGWVTIDAEPTRKPTLIATVPPLPPGLKDQKFEVIDEIEMIHFLEHLYYWDAIQLLKECDDILEPNGYLVIECPNIEWCARHLLGQVNTPSKGAKKGQFDMWGFYGDPTREQPLYNHRWGWTPDSLAEEIRSIGPYAITTPEARHHNPIRDFRLEAKKL